MATHSVHRSPSPTRRGEIERLKLQAAELGRYSVRIAIVLSLVLSLMALAILSKRRLTHQLSACVAACALPMPVALYFRDRIVLLGVVSYVAALVIALAAAVLFAM